MTNYTDVLLNPCRAAERQIPCAYDRAVLSWEASPRHCFTKLKHRSRRCGPCSAPVGHRRSRSDGGRCDGARSGRRVRGSWPRRRARAARPSSSSTGSPCLSTRSVSCARALGQGCGSRQYAVNMLVSATCPPVEDERQRPGLPVATRWIFVVKPPRDRPIAWSGGSGPDFL